MVFSSVTFLFTFLPITLVLYYAVPKRVKNIMLFLCSLVFYAWGEPVYIILMVLSILFNYVCGLDIARNLDCPQKAKASLIFNIVVNLAILGFFKYYGFLIENVNAVFSSHIPYRVLALPIGISFYTFQTLSYTIDVYRGKVKEQKNLVSFGLHVSMFPQLIAGPIVRYSDIERQLQKREHSLERFGEGAQIFIRGLAKKVLIANTSGMMFEKITSLTSSEMSAASAWIGCAAYLFQIYFDFSGYSDMAVGLASMFGFKLERNFNYPYISKSITEFWRRWHISLSTWFREYVYIPLGGNRVSKRTHVRNILVVWLLTGFWHGASWNFIVWGLYYGIILLIEKYVINDALTKLPAIVRHIYSLVLVMIGWVFFFSPDLGSAVHYLGMMFGAGGIPFCDERALYYLFSNWLLWLMAAAGSAPFLFRLYQKLTRRSKEARAAVNTVCYGVLLFLCIAYLVTETYNPFLYFRF